MEFLQIFTQMNWIPALLLCLGLVFIIIEVFVPGFGFFGVTGILSLIAGIVVRIVQGLNLAQSLALILIVIGFLTICCMFMVFSAQHGILGKTGIFENRTSLSTDYNKLDKQTRKLIGKSGRTVGVLNPGGKAKINGKIYDVVSLGTYIEENAHVKVIDIKDNTIVVRKWFE